MDTSDDGKAILEEAFRVSPGAITRFPRTYNSIARKLNKYMNEKRSISVARNIADADFILFFNVLEIRRPLGYPYAYGELFVISNDRTNDSPPQIVWRTKKSGMFADDAIDTFIKSLKEVRGEG